VTLCSRPRVLASVATVRPSPLDRIHLSLSRGACAKSSGPHGSQVASPAHPIENPDLLVHHERSMAGVGVPGSDTRSQVTADRTSNRGDPFASRSVLRNRRSEVRILSGALETLVTRGVLAFASCSTERRIAWKLLSRGTSLHRRGEAQRPLFRRPRLVPRRRSGATARGGPVRRRAGVDDLGLDLRHGDRRPRHRDLQVPGAVLEPEHDRPGRDPAARSRAWRSTMAIESRG